MRPTHFEFTSTFLPVSEKTTRLVNSGGTSEQGKLLLANRVSITQEWPIELEANFSFYGPWNSAGNETINAAGTGL